MIHARNQKQSILFNKLGHAFLLFLLYLTLGIPIQSQDIRADVSSQLSTNFATDGDFSSPINPNNQFGLTDVSFLNNANLRFETGNDVTALDFRLDFQSFPIAEILIGYNSIISPTLLDAGASVSNLELQSTALADLVFFSGTQVWSATLSRANIAWFPNEWFQLVLGRQKINQGYGFAWNPMDFVNAPKNANDPTAFVFGTDALSLGFIPSDWFELYTYLLVPNGAQNWEQLQYGVDLSLFLNLVEIKASGFWGGIERSSDSLDPNPSGGGLGFFLDLFDLGFYGEAALRTRSRRSNINSSGTLSLDSELQFSALAGLEYVFESGLALTFEYFYNQEGWNQTERGNYRDTVSLLPSMTAEYYRLYTPFYFSEHYGFINLHIPLYDLDSSLDFTAIMSH
jgi:hypothetical protein